MESARLVTVSGQTSSAHREQTWLVFERDVTHRTTEEQSIAAKSNLRVQIAFSVSDLEPSGQPNINKLDRSHLNVFFPTQKETHLGFLVQGPFRTTPARDNIPEADEFNIMLAQETGELVVEALRWLRKRDWLTIEVLRTMPLADRNEYRSDYYDRFRPADTERNRFKNTLFAPVYERVKQAMTEEPLLPAFGGGYVAAKYAKIAGSADLRVLLDNSQLQQLLDFNAQTRWLTEEITVDRTRDLWQHLRDILEVEVIDAEKLVSRLDHDFMSDQPDEWIRRFYEFAPTRPNMLRNLRDKPIIRLEDGKHVKPFHWSAPQAYLPKEHESRYPTVKREVCDTTGAMDFLKTLGLKEPDDVDEVLTLVLRKYRSGHGIEEADHLKDIELIVRALDSDSYKRRQTLRNELESTPFLRATNSVGDTAYCKPGDIYFHSRELEIYFEGNPDGWFISSIYEQHYEDLQQLGIRHTVRVWNRQPNDGRYITVQTPWRGSKHYPHKRGRNGFDPKFNIEGLEFALSRPSMARSKCIWNWLLIPRKHSIYGDIESCPDQKFPSHRTQVEKNVLSNAGKLLRDMAWLPDGNGDFVTPSELALDDLPDEFRKDSDFAKVLGMRAGMTGLHDLLARDDLYMSEEDMLRIELVNHLPDDVVRLLSNNPELVDQLHRRVQDEVEESNPSEYPPELDKVFEPRMHSVPPNRSRLTTTDLRETTVEDERVNVELELGQEQVLAPLNIGRKPNRRNIRTEQFFRDEYDGHCQICDSTFQKESDGLNYFVIDHLIWRSKGVVLDDPRNALCLCPNHWAQLKWGTVETLDSDILDQIRRAEDGQSHEIAVLLCGEPHIISFSANHIAMLRALVEVTENL